MQVFMNGQPTFDQEFYDELAECLISIDPRLLESVGAQWNGMIKYANTSGTESDPWPSCENNLKWFEYNCTTQEYGNMPITEPCNYASNIAYYHTVTEICAREKWTLQQDQGI